jgi:hypothetical protein
MAFGTWRSPWPRRFGGGSTKRITRLYDRIHANLGSAITDDPSSIADVENKAAARLLATADRAIERRVVQADPRKLTEPLLSRWEAWLGITVSINDSDQTRRTRVATRLLSFYDGGSGSIASIIETGFATWTAQARYHSLAEAATLWLGSTPAGSASDWYSSVALITIEYFKPINATIEEEKSRVDACRTALDAVLPAWVTFCFSGTPVGGSYGFFLDISRLNFTAF